MRRAAAVLLVALLAGCTEPDAPGDHGTDDGGTDDVPSERSTRTTTGAEDPPAGTSDNLTVSSSPKRLQTSGTAGEWVIAIQRFSGEVAEFSMEYDASFRTTPGANVLHLDFVTNHAGDWGLSDHFDAVVEVSTGEWSRSGSLGAGGQDYRGVATAWASDAPWSVDVRLDPTAKVRDLVVLRGTGATFQTAVGQAGLTPLQFEAILDLPVGEDDLVIVQPDVGDPSSPFTSGAAPRSEWVPELPNGEQCHPVADATVFRDHPAAGDWKQPGTIHAALRTTGWTEPPAIRAVSIPLAGAELPDGWELGSYCDAYG